MFTLIFFPSISFNILAAEIFPYAILLFFYFSLKYKVVNSSHLLFIIVFTAVVLLQNLLLEINEQQAIRSYFAYSNAMLAYFVSSLYISQCGNERILIMTKRVFLFFVITSFLQYFNLIGFLEPVFNLLKSRGEVSGTIGIRGVSIFSTEPSRAAYEVILLYSVSRIYLIKLGKKKIFIVDSIFLLYLVFIIKSMTGVVSCALLLTFFYLKPKKFLYILLAIFSVVIAGYIFKSEIVLYLSSSDNRSLLLFSQLLNSDSYLNVLIPASGFRLISVISSYVYVIDNIFGGGVGNWANTSIEALNFINASEYKIPYFMYTCNEYVCGVRPTSIFANIFLDFGVFGLFFICFIVVYLKKKLHPRYYHIYFYLLFCFFFNSSTGHPLPWFILSLIIYLSKSELNNAT